MNDPSLFVVYTSPGRAVLFPDWPIMAVRVDLTGTRSLPAASPPPTRKRERGYVVYAGAAPLAAISLGIGII
jgi:hypothetical protein